MSDKKWPITITELYMAVVTMDCSSTAIMGRTSRLFSVILTFMGSGLAMGRYHVQVEGPDPLQLKKKRPKEIAEDLKLN
jgi:hypothetical protein